MKDPDTILDASITPPKDSPVYKWMRRIAIAIEVMFWVIGLVALLFKYESWEGGSELLVLSFSLLTLFYLCLTFLVTGAWGWKRILGAAGVGISLCFLLMGGMFVMESWTGGTEMLILGRVFAGIAAIVTLVFLILATRHGKRAAFYWNVLVRLAVVFLFG